jgi:adenosylcobinamide-GDP ribazoletransferase
VVEATRFRDGVAASGFALAVGGLALGRSGVLAASMAIGSAGLLAWLARRQIGGVTGDVLGAAVELGEVVFLVGLGSTGG